MKFLSLISLFCLYSLQSKAQSNYFQQEVNYTIDVELNDQEHTLFGQVSFEYVNNSPDTLREMYIHLWPNAYKNDKTALAKQLAREGNYYLSFAINKNKGSIDSLDFKVNNERVSFVYYKNQEDVTLLILPQPLAPGDRVKVETPFKVHVPIGTISRLGHIGQSYQITQWYPKPAVYDHNGWNPMSYLTQGEFYSEYGSFDVKITLPDNYTVGATGVLETSSEIDRLNRLSQMPYTTQPELDAFPESDVKKKTLTYRTQNVHDFGWFADKRWIVRKGEVKLPESGNTVTTWAMFTPSNAALWKKAIGYINETILTYSDWVGEYPYPQCTAVDGTISAGGGMEYPMVTVIGNSGNDEGLETVIVHEVGHNWFYGILGSNERENGWMDEGINSFMETRTIEIARPDAKIYDGILNQKLAKTLNIPDFPLNYQNELMYQLVARIGNDQPIQTSSEDFTSMNYGSVMYKKTGLAFNYLRNYLGDDLFKKCMHAYFETWKFKHPTPANLQDIFEKTSNKDLGWFFNEVIKGNGVVDMAVTSVKKGEKGYGGYEVTVFNNGTVTAPFSIAIIHDGKVVGLKWYDPIAPGYFQTVSLENAAKGDEIKVNSQEGSIDIQRKNNNGRTKGILRKSEPVSLSFLTGLENPEKSQLFWMPVAGWNNYDKWMYGVNVHNKTIPFKKLNFSATPLYSFSTNRVVGMASLEYLARTISFGIRSRTFTSSRQESLNERTPGAETIMGYVQINPYFEWKARTHSAVTSWKLKLRWDGFITQTFRDDLLDNSRSNRMNSGKFGRGSRISAILQKDFIGGSFTATPSFINLNSNSSFNGAAAMIQTKTEVLYWKRKKRKVIFEAFAGATHRNNPYFPLMWGGTRAAGDVFYEGLYFGRGERSGILSNQIISNQGGVLMPIHPFAFGTPQTMLTVYAEMDLPVKLPIALFGGWGVGKEQDPLWSAGVTIPIKRDVIQIYAPLVFSNNIQSKIDRLDLGWQDYIMFELNLDLINPFNFLKDL